MTRLPADSSLSMKPPPWLACDPSPNTVSIRTALSFEHQRAGFGDRGLARIQLDLDELHLLAVDAEVDFVGAAFAAIARRRRRRGRRIARDAIDQLGDVARRQPVAHAVPSMRAGRVARGCARAASRSIGPRRCWLAGSCRYHWLIASSRDRDAGGVYGARRRRAGADGRGARSAGRRRRARPPCHAGRTGRSSRSGACPGRACRRRCGCGARGLGLARGIQPLDEIEARGDGDRLPLRIGAGRLRQRGAQVRGQRRLRPRVARATAAATRGRPARCRPRPAPRAATSASGRLRHRVPAPR